MEIIFFFIETHVDLDDSIAPECPRQDNFLILTLDLLPQKKYQRYRTCRLIRTQAPCGPVCERSADLARSVGIGWLPGYLI